MQQPAPFDRLLQIMDDLREKCPWDRKQTLASLRQLTLEEMYELTDAISATDWPNIREELGDVLLHLVFYAKIASEQQQFTMNDVINALCEKLIVRHPHIYGDVQADTDEAVKRNWEKIKLKEGKKSVLAGVPAGMPALIKAMRLQEKSKQVGFEWDNTQQVYAKLEEELQELQQAINSGEQDAIEDEMGDVLFSLVNYARFIKVDAENALERTNKKFIRRFQWIENKASEKGTTLADLSLDAMNALWEEVKREEKSK
ncbi:XTP/dITP diphosphohydrolase [Chitinophaga costaii]|uniref:Nucleoside triphosphate pyrophosphohydrolase n=1 Tax=Chitinophaga costaii TaxID=1335309 RepID=A0A1C4E9E3_9BACT|nr:nucleoside triphosphate pyrophosphohydrolase [Chitinophaga costaii]PUZ24234.1 nucleoside triphosphate pyrophosphohydrolase [Chitinophaga costaii]SCC40184.1 XTP/dITP diphosphohydrolase [Chitinophaga costaii]